MSEIFEEATKAILDAMDIADGLNASAAENYARAAIDVLSKVSEDLPLAVLLAGKKSLYSCSEDPEIDDARNCFAAMLYALLAEGEPIEPPPPAG